MGRCRLRSLGPDGAACPHISGSHASKVLRLGQPRGEFFLRVENTPLDGPDRDATRGSNLVIFPTLYEAQRHHVAFPGFQGGHPLPELEISLVCRHTEWAWQPVT